MLKTLDHKIYFFTLSDYFFLKLGIKVLRGQEKWHQNVKSLLCTYESNPRKATSTHKTGVEFYHYCHR